MSKETDYPLFIPPKEIRTKEHHNWAYKEAEIYFDWMMEVRNRRVEYLLSFLDEKKTSDPEEDLGRIGQKVYLKLLSEPFSIEEDGKRILTNKGLALAADVSLLLSEYILVKHPTLKWGIVRRPKKDYSFHLPTLMPYPTYGHLELMGTSIMGARNMVLGNETSDKWLRIYRTVSDKLKDS